MGIPWQSKVRTQRFQCQGPDSILDQGFKIPQTKWHGKKKKKGRETNYPKLKWLKTNVDYIIVSKHQESRSNLAEWDLAWDLSWVAVTLVRATSSEVLLGLEGPLPKWLIHRAGSWCWLSDRVSQFSSLWSLQQDSLDFFIWWLVSKRERERRVKVFIEAVTL